MSSIPESIQLEDWIRDIPDFPQKGILFKDITPLLQDKAAFHAALDRLLCLYVNSANYHIRQRRLSMNWSMARIS